VRRESQQEQTKPANKEKRIFKQQDPSGMVRGLVFSARFATVKGGPFFTRIAKGIPSMAQWVSFDEVKSRVSIQDVLAHYALMQGTVEKASKHGLELRLRCPFHEDPTPSLSINAETGKFHTPSNLVVAHWPSDVESTAPLDFLLRHGLWTPFGCPMSCKIRSIISAGCDFTTKWLIRNLYKILW
jgi:CHC2 zinc finger